MKPVLKTLFLLLLPALSFGQSIEMPLVKSNEDPSTTITKIEVTNDATVVSFRHHMYNGSWVQLNKSMYIQDANGEDRYNLIKSEGIPLRPARYTAAQDTEKEFTIYFEKLKPGTTEINLIERARSVQDINNGVGFFNFYNVSLLKSAPVIKHHLKITGVTLTAPDLHDTSLVVREDLSSMAPMMSRMYSSMLTEQMKIYSNPEIIGRLAKITKSYYDALMKEGFTPNQALTIITSKPLLSPDAK